MAGELIRAQSAPGGGLLERMLRPERLYNMVITDPSQTRRYGSMREHIKTSRHKLHMLTQASRRARALHTMGRQ